MDRGTLVYDAGPLPPINVADWIKKGREAIPDDQFGPSMTFVDTPIIVTATQPNDPRQALCS